MNGLIKRVYVIYFLLIVLTIRILWKIIFLQYFADIKITDADISFRIEEIEANRGSILAKDGRPLSASVPYYQIRMDCVVPAEDLFNKNIDALASALSSFYKNKSAAAYKNEIIAARRTGKRYMPIGNRLVDYSEMLEVKEFPLFKEGSIKGGLITEQRNRRNNPYGRLAYRTIGFINTMGVGVGIEGSFDHQLRGNPGRQTVQRMLGGEWVPVIGDDIILPKDGYDILTTLDIDIQEATENALRDQLSRSEELEGATAIVMEVKSGAIRAIANMKKGSGGLFDESYNYAIGEATEPGSTFKLATLVALIEDGFVTLDSPIDAGNGRWSYRSASFSDVSHSGFGKITVQEAFEKSSNVAFAKLAVDHYANNEKRFVDRLMNMKITERFNLEIMGEARAVMHSPGDAIWSGVTLPSMAIGYSSLLTPLHVLAFYNAIANNGKMMKPYFIENLQTNGVVFQHFGPQEVSGSVCSKRTLEQVQRALRGVVENGTGRIINDPRYQISGKTGTARVAFDGRYTDAQGYRKYQASFAGFFPSDNPQYSVIVVLYSSKTKGNFYGGLWSAPVFKAIADKIYSTSPQWHNPLVPGSAVAEGEIPVLSGRATAIKQAITVVPGARGMVSGNSEWLRKGDDNNMLISYNIPDNGVPDVTDMGLKDALYLLENSGYRVRYRGRGKVISQTPQGGSLLRKNEIVQIQLSQSDET